MRHEETDSTFNIQIYTDGSCLRNPNGPGGWAAYITVDHCEIDLAGHEKYTTNNRMELMGAIKGLEAFTEPYKILVYSDSRYLVNGITQWMDGWKRKNWAKVKNIDLWKRLDQLNQFHDVRWVWVKAHNGNFGNERADMLAGYAALNIFTT